MATKVQKLPASPAGIEAAPEVKLPPGTRYLETLLERHNVEKHRRAALVAKVLEVSHQSAWRRVTGASASDLTFEELEKIAAHFGETLEHVFTAAGTSGFERGVFTAGSLSVPCAFTLGPKYTSASRTRFVAIKRSLDWSVIPAVDYASSGDEARQVIKLVLETQPSYAYRIAVLDDDAEITKYLCELLKQAGYKAEAFNRTDRLAEAARAKPFDVYLLDWMVGTSSVRKLMDELRALDKSAAIALLTGASGQRVASDIADAATAYRVGIFKKPIDVEFMLPAIRSLLEQRKANAG